MAANMRERLREELRFLVCHSEVVMIESKQAAAAFVRAQKQFGPALKTNTNPAFKSRYADLGACVEAVIDALNANGLALLQITHEVDSGVCVETLLVHESGEQISGGKLRLPASKQDPQGYGSALTYARRYSLMATCGIAPEDDDGNAAGKATQGRQAAAPASQAKRDPDMSPAARAARIKASVAAGDADGAATAMAGWPEVELNAVWALLDDATQDKLTAAWPK